MEGKGEKQGWVLTRIQEPGRQSAGSSGDKWRDDYDCDLEC